MNGWGGSSDWKHVGKMLVNDGSQTTLSGGWIRAPYRPDTANYAIEAEIQLLNTECTKGV
jgi:hypothetical protein